MGAKRPISGALTAVLCSLVVLLALALPLARPAKAQTAEEKARATAYFKQGGKAYGEGRYLEAVRLYKSAYKSLKHRSISFNIALSYEKAQLAVEAAKWTRIYQADGKIPDAKLPPELKRALTKVGLLVVVALQRGTLVFVDGRQAGASPLRKIVLPGRRRVELRVGSKVLFRRVVRVDGGKTVRVVQERIRIRARVLSRRRVGKRPRERVDPKPNPRPGHPPARRSLLGRLHWGWLTAAATVTVASLVGAAVMSKKTLDSFHELKLPVSQRPSGLRDRLSREQQITNVLWGISGAAAVGAALIAVFTRWRKRDNAREKANRISIHPTVTRPGVQLHVRW